MINANMLTSCALWYVVFVVVPNLREIKVPHDEHDVPRRAQRIGQYQKS